MQALVQMDTAVKAVEERFVAQESSIEQRLKWAAGANPALNPVLQNFDKALGDRKKLLLVSAMMMLNYFIVEKNVKLYSGHMNSTLDITAVTEKRKKNV